MSDEQATLGEDSAGTDSSADVDWQKRFTDTQAEYTRQQQSLKEQEAIWDDEQAFLARAAEKFPHLIAEDEEAEVFAEPGEPGMDPAVLKQIQAQQAQLEAIQAERAEQRFETDLNKYTPKDREVSPQAHDWILFTTMRNGNTPDALQKAVGEWFSYEDQIRTPPETKPTRRPATTLTGGAAVTDGKPVADMSRAELNQFMVERVRASESQI